MLTPALVAALWFSLQAQVEARQVSTAGAGIVCTALTRMEARRYGATGVSIAMCVELHAGEVLGYAIDKKGRARCSIYGFATFATRCITVSACGGPRVTSCG